MWSKGLLEQDLEETLGGGDFKCEFGMVQMEQLRKSLKEGKKTNRGGEQKKGEFLLLYSHWTVLDLSSHRNWTLDRNLF